MNINKDNQIKQIIWLLPLVIAIAFSPLFVFVKQLQLSGDQFNYWVGKSVNYDLFTYYRSIILVSVSFCSIILLLLHRRENGIVHKSLLIFTPVFIYLALLLVTIFFSNFTAVSLLGFVERYEGGLVLISYMICLISAYQIVNDQLDIKILLYTLIVSSAFIGIFGALQYFGADPFNSNFYQSIIFPKDLEHLSDKILDPPGRNVIYATLYNPNNVGSYASMLFPISFGLFLFAKKKSYQVLLAIYTCLMFILWIGSRSRAGMVGATLAIFLFIIFSRKTIVQNKKKLLIIVPYILIFFIMNITAGNSLLAKISSLSPSYEKDRAEDRTIIINDIIFDEHRVTIDSAANKLTIEFKGNQMLFLDDQSNQLTTYKNDNFYLFADDLYSDYRYSFVAQESSKQLIALELKNSKMNYYMDETGVYIVGTHGRIYNDITNAPSIGFENYQHFGSGRGYIWSRSLPMLKETILIGHGPDTFPMYYPQDDWIGKLNTFRRTNAIIDKPHSFYLQVAHNTGVSSLLTLLVLFVIYLLQSVKLYLKRKYDTFYTMTGKIVCCSVLGYLVTSSFNDSVIYVAPIFWTLLGTGFAVNYIVRKNEKDSQLSNLE